MIKFDNMYLKKCFILACALSAASASFGESETWPLQQCFDYALQQNINVQKGRIVLEQDRISTHQAKGQWLPSANISASQSLNNSPFTEMGYANNYSGNYNLGVSWTVFNGFRRKYNIKQQELQETIQETSLKSTEEDIKISVLSCYLQILYAKENVQIRKNSLETSSEQLNRYKQLYEAGSVSKIDLSQVESQHVAETYQLTVAENQLANDLLQLKQLLRLDLNQEIDIPSMELSVEQVTAQLVNKDSVYAAALATRPEIAMAELNETMSDLQIKSAKSGYYPSVNLSAGVGTGHRNHVDLSGGDQLKQNFGENIGLSLNYAILDNRERKSTLSKAKLNRNIAELETDNLKDELKKTIESAYLDAQAAQMNFLAAQSNEQAAASTYELTKEKFSLGMKSPFEMLSERNTLLNAQQQTLQAKYTAILNMQILRIYQGLPVEIE